MLILTFVAEYDAAIKMYLGEVRNKSDGRVEIGKCSIAKPKRFERCAAAVHEKSALFVVKKTVLEGVVEQSDRRPIFAAILCQESCLREIQRAALC